MGSELKKQYWSWRKGEEGGEGGEGGGGKRKGEGERERGRDNHSCIVSIVPFILFSKFSRVLKETFSQLICRWAL